MGTSMSGSGTVSLTRAANRATSAHTPWGARLCSLLVLALIFALSAPVGAQVSGPAVSVADDPFGASLLGMPAAGPVAVSSATLTDGLVDDQGPATLPSSQDLAATSMVSAQLGAGIARTAIVFANSMRVPVDSARGDSVTGAELALGAPNVAGHGVGSAAVGSEGSDGSSSATIDGPATPPTHSDFALTRLEHRSATLDTSIRPLVRPG